MFELWFNHIITYCLYCTYYGLQFKTCDGAILNSSRPTWEKHKLGRRLDSKDLHINFLSYIIVHQFEVKGFNLCVN